jgi:hypothetical protein
MIDSDKNRSRPKKASRIANAMTVALSFSESNWWCSITLVPMEVTRCS